MKLLIEILGNIDNVWNIEQSNDNENNFIRFRDKVVHRTETLYETGLNGTFIVLIFSRCCRAINLIEYHQNCIEWIGMHLSANRLHIQAALERKQKICCVTCLK